MMIDDDVYQCETYPMNDRLVFEGTIWREPFILKFFDDDGNNDNDDDDDDDDDRDLNK